MHCEENALDDTLNIVIILKEEIEKLKTDLTEKDNFITKIKEGRKKFEEDALENEECLNAEIEELKQSIWNLQQKYNDELQLLRLKISDLEKEMSKTKNNGLTTEKSTQTSAIRLKNSGDQTETEQNDSIQINKEVIANDSVIAVNSSETSTQEKEKSITRRTQSSTNSERKKRTKQRDEDILNQNSSLMNDQVSTIAANEDNEICENEKSIEQELKEAEEKVPVQVLIVGDEYARNCSIRVNTLINDKNYEVRGMVKPNIQVNQIADKIFQETKHLGERDYLIVMTKTSNISNHKSLHLFTKQILPTSRYTNLLILLKCCNRSDNYICNFILKKCSIFQKLNINVSLQINIEYERETQNISYLISKYITGTKLENIHLVKSIKTISFQNTRNNINCSQFISPIFLDPTCQLMNSL